MPANKNNSLFLVCKHMYLPPLLVTTEVWKKTGAICHPSLSSQRTKIRHLYLVIIWVITVNWEFGYSSIGHRVATHSGWRQDTEQPQGRVTYAVAPDQVLTRAPCFVECSATEVLNNSLFGFCFANEILWDNGACVWAEDLHTAFVSAVPCCSICIWHSTCPRSTEFWGTLHAWEFCVQGEYSDLHLKLLLLFIKRTVNFMVIISSFKFSLLRTTFGSK